jgi:hypothetical protein
VLGVCWHGKPAPNSSQQVLQLVFERAIIAEIARDHRRHERIAVDTGEIERVASPLPNQVQE